MIYFSSGFTQRPIFEGSVQGVVVHARKYASSPETLKRCKPYLIKPNLYELQILLNDKGITKENAKEAIARLRQEGVEKVLLSLGKDGALLGDEEGFLYLVQPNTVLVNKVGAGDAMLAAFLGKLTETGDRELALRYGGAAGNAVASRLEDIDGGLIEEYLNRMSVKE